MQTKSLIAIFGLLLVTAITVALAAPPKPMELLSTTYTFQDFLADFPRDYTQSNSSDEYLQRKAIFEKELAAVIAHNQLGLSWTKGINNFSDLTNEEFVQQYTGHYLQSEDLTALRLDQANRIADKFLGATTPTASDLLADMTGLPTSVDWANRVMPNLAPNQLKCGSCYSFTASNLLSAYLYPLAGKSIELSTQQAVSCFPNPRECGGTGGCHGYTSGHVMQEYAKDVGIVTEADYPYVSGDGNVPECAVDEEMLKKVVVKTSGAERLPPNDPTALLKQLAFGGPVSVSLSGSGIKNYASGVLMECHDGVYDETYKMYENTISHAMILVGYGVTTDGVGYWKIRNSWGPAWGNDSYAYVYRPIGKPEQEFINKKPSSGYHCKDDDLSPVVVAGTCGLLANTWFPNGVQYFPPQ